MAVPETAVRGRVKQLVASVYAAEGWTAADDKLPRSWGHEQDAGLAVSPERAERDPRDAYMLVIPVLFQLYLPFVAEVNEAQAVDPGVIEALGDRLRRGFSAQSSGNTGDLWYLTLDRIEYPDDPTGNKTRLEAYITGRAENPAAF